MPRQKQRTTDSTHPAAAGRRQQQAAAVAQRGRYCVDVGQACQDARQVAQERRAWVEVAGQDQLRPTQVLQEGSGGGGGGGGGAASSTACGQYMGVLSTALTRTGHHAVGCVSLGWQRQKLMVRAEPCSDNGNSFVWRATEAGPGTRWYPPPPDAAPRASPLWAGSSP